MVKIEPSHKNGLSKISSADCFQIRSISHKRFIKKLGIVSDSVSEDIKIAISKVLSINNF